MVEQLAPQVFVCCSADLIPRWGEYERTVATVLNAYLGPVMSRYLGRLESRAQTSGLRFPLQVMQCGGGVIPAAESARRAFLTLDSGPVAGVLASQYLGSIVGHKHVIATDMGGTSFDVGLVWDGEPVASYQSVVHQYEYFVPRIDIRSIGSGGAGPVHAGVYARELGAQSVVVPLGGLCSLWSALGAASADLLHIYEAVDIQSSPFDPVRVMQRFAELEARGRAQLHTDGIDPTQARLARSADIRYKGQINEVEVPVPAGTLDESALAQLVSDFHRRYETVYGQGAGFREARVEVVTYRVRASAVSAKPRIVAVPEVDRAPSRDASAGTRPVYWSELGDFDLTPVFWGERLVAGNVVPGPAIIQVPDTTIVVHPFETARIDPYGNVLVDLGGK